MTNEFVLWTFTGNHWSEYTFGPDKGKLDEQAEQMRAKFPGMAITVLPVGAGAPTAPPWTAN